MKTTQQLIEYIKSRPGITNREILKNLIRHNVGVGDVEKARAALAGQPSTPAASPRKIGQSINALMDQFDDVKKVKQAMKKLPKDSFAEDDEMRRNLHIAYDRWRTVAQHPSLAAYRFTLPNRKAVWMHPEAQEKVTAAINLDQQ